MEFSSVSLFLCFFIHYLDAVTNSIPQEVLSRYGGLTKLQKKELYDRQQSIDFAYIPPFLKSQIFTLASLDNFGVCQSSKIIEGRTFEYFVCPSVTTTNPSPYERELRFCCGMPPKQYCCSSTQFASYLFARYNKKLVTKIILCVVILLSAGVRLVRSALIISPSVVFGIILGFLFLVTFLIIVVYARIARGLRKQSAKFYYDSVSLVYGSHNSRQPLGPAVLSDISSIEPPRKQLISSIRSSKISQKHIPVLNQIPEDIIKKDTNLAYEDQNIVKQSKPLNWNSQIYSENDVVKARRLGSVR